MLMLRGLMGGASQILVIAALLLLPADTWRWPRALQFLAVYGVVREALTFLRTERRRRRASAPS